MSGWRRGAAVVAVLALAGCGAGDSTSPTGATPAAALAGSTWRLTTIAGQSVVAGSTVTAEFSSGNRVAGSAGCNRYSGSATADSGRLTVGPLASTLMACPPDAVMAQEYQYLAALQAARRYAIRGDELRLGPGASETTLVFTSR